MGWVEFAAVFVVFFLSHAVPVRPPVRPWLVAHLGERGFTLAYSLLSLIILGWLIGAAGRAPFVAVWDFASWQKHVTLALMLPVCLLITLAAGRPNPFSFGGPDTGFDPARPGVLRWTPHPLLLALLLWALAHLVPNGDLAHVILFGCFAGFAALGPWIVTRRRRRIMGAVWDRHDAALRHAPLTPRPNNWRAACMRVALGCALYLGLIAAHPALFGVSPLP